MVCGRWEFSRKKDMVGGPRSCLTPTMEAAQVSSLVRGDVGDPWVAALCHLTASHLGLPPQQALGVPCGRAAESR